MNPTRKLPGYSHLLLASFTLCACESREPSRNWTSAPDSTSFRSIQGHNTPCTECISLNEIAVLGTDTLEGFLEDRGTIQSVVRDREGRYWAGQRTTIKVFAPSGAFIRSVGRGGQGPMEFAFAQPVHADATGNVHVFDARLGRETVIGPDFSHRTDRTLPVAFDEMATVPGEGHRYVIAKWATDSGGRPRPLHLVSGPETHASFGVRSQSSETETVRGMSGRKIAVGPTGHVFSSQVDSYEIEVWTLDGDRVAGFSLPNLNAEPVRMGALWAADNPPRNSVSDVTAYNSDHIWVITRHRRPDWLDNTVQRSAPGVGNYLEPEDGMMSSVFRTRIDLLDLNTAAIVASSWHDGLLLRFIEPRLILELNYNDNGAPLLRVLEVNVQRRYN